MLTQLNLCKWLLIMKLNRQVDLIEEGKTIDQETRLFDTKKK